MCTHRNISPPGGGDVLIKRLDSRLIIIIVGERQREVDGERERFTKRGMKERGQGVAYWSRRVSQNF